MKKSVVYSMTLLFAMLGQVAQAQWVERVPNSLISPQAGTPRMVSAEAMEQADDACFDMTNLGDASKIRCVDYDVQYDSKTGFYGWDAALSPASHPRQQLVTSGTDDLVPSLSMTPPSGGNAIRMATDAYKATDMGKGALTTFYHVVDAKNPIIKLNYAAVLENGKHAIAGTSGFEQYAQPWIWIYAYYWDKSGDVKIMDCIDILHYPNTASTIKDWKTVTSDAKGRAAIWKDWSTLTWDMSKYIGQKIGIIIEIHDCAEMAYDKTTQQITLCTNHELAHLYCSMECASGDIVQSCTGESTTVNLTAPAGFTKYKWYATNKPTQSLGTTQTISVPANTTVNYTCEIASDCNTTKFTTTVHTNTYAYEKTIEAGQEYDFYGQKLSTAGTYTKVVPNKPNYNGCDSIEILTLKVNVPQIITQECNGNDITLTAPLGYTSYQWMDTYMQKIQGATNIQYTVSLQSDESARYICHMEDGKGSILELDATVWSNRHTYTQVIKEGESYDFYGQKLTVKGQYTHTLTGQSYLGCDSIVILNLIVKQDQKEGCFDMTDIENGNIDLRDADFGIVGKQQGKDVYGWKDPIASPYNHPRQTMMAAPGTDNLIPQLSVLPPNQQTSFRLASNAYQTGDLAKGSDMELTYIVDAENPIVVIQYACVIENPNNTASKQYEQEANPWIQLWLKRGAAEGIIVNHNPYDASSVSGTGWKSVTSDAAGNKAYWKDWSTVSLDLSALAGQAVSIVLRQRDCAVESITTTVNPCTKHHQSHLYAYLSCAPMKIIQTCSNTGVTMTAPDGCTYQWYKGNSKLTGETNQTLTVNYPASDKSETYYCELGGIITPQSPLRLSSVVYSNTHSFEKTINAGETYDFYGDKYSTEGTYTKVVPNKSTYLGCDSVEVLTLHVNASCVGTAKMKKDSICANEANMTIVLNYTEGQALRYQLNFSEDAQAAGFDNKAMTDLQGDEIVIDLKHEANPQMVGGIGYQRPGRYEVTVTEETTCGNKVTHTLPFTIMYPASIITQRWNDVLALNNADYNGGYTFSNIRWYHEGEGEIKGRGAHNSYIYAGAQGTLVMGTEYWAELTRQDDGKTVCTCRLIPQTQNDDTSFGANRKVNIIHRNGSKTIDLKTEISGKYYIYNTIGQLVMNGTFGDEFGVSSIDLSQANGTVLLIHFQGNEGTKETSKIITF